MMSVLGAFGDMRPRSKSRLVYALMQSPQFSEFTVQAACYRNDHQIAR